MKKDNTQIIVNLSAFHFGAEQMELPCICSAVCIGITVLPFNGVDLKVKFYYMHLKNVELEFQRGE